MVGETMPGGPPAVGGVVARVGDEEITEAELEARLAQYSQRLGGRLEALAQDQREGIRQSILERIVEEKLLGLASAQEPVDKEEFQKALDQAIARYGSRESWQADRRRGHRSEETFGQELKEKLRREKWLSRALPPLPAPSVETLEAYYEEHREFFNPPGEIRTSHILWVLPSNADEARIEQKRQQALAFASEAKETDDFTALIEKHRGAQIVAGDLGFQSLGEMPPAYAEAARKLKTGEVSAPVCTDLGWHVFQITERKSPPPSSFRDVRPRVEAAFRREAKARQWREVIDGLRAKYGVKIASLPPAPADDPGERPPK